MRFLSSLLSLDGVLGAVLAVLVVMSSITAFVQPAAAHPDSDYSPFKNDPDVCDGSYDICPAIKFAGHLQGANHKHLDGGGQIEVVAREATNYYEDSEVVDGDPPYGQEYVGHRLMFAIRTENAQDPVTVKSVEWVGSEGERDVSEMIGITRDEVEEKHGVTIDHTGGRIWTKADTWNGTTTRYYSSDDPYFEDSREDARAGRIGLDIKSPEGELTVTYVQGGMTREVTTKVDLDRDDDGIYDNSDTYPDSPAKVTEVTPDTSNREAYAQVQIDRTESTNHVEYVIQRWNETSEQWEYARSNGVVMDGAWHTGADPGVAGINTSIDDDGMVGAWRGSEGTLGGTDPYSDGNPDVITVRYALPTDTSDRSKYRIVTHTDDAVSVERGIHYTDSQVWVLERNETRRMAGVVMEFDNSSTGEANIDVDATSLDATDESDELYGWLNLTLKDDVHINASSNYVNNFEINESEAMGEDNAIYWHEYEDDGYPTDEEGYYGFTNESKHEGHFLNTDEIRIYNHKPTDGERLNATHAEIIYSETNTTTTNTTTTTTDGAGGAGGGGGGFGTFGVVGILAALLLALIVLAKNERDDGDPPYGGDL